MNTYYATLGVQYKHEPHPVLTASQANPDGWLEVQAQTEERAREIIHAVLGSAYAFLYREDSFTDRDRWHPLGCLGVIVHGVFPPEPKSEADTLLAEAASDLRSLKTEGA